MAYQGTAPSGNTRGDTPLAGGRQSATDRGRDGDAAGTDLDLHLYNKRLGGIVFSSDDEQ